MRCEKVMTGLLVLRGRTLILLFAGATTSCSTPPAPAPASRSSTMAVHVS
jgi:hypothetical protein